ETAAFACNLYGEGRIRSAPGIQCHDFARGDNRSPAARAAPWSGTRRGRTAGLRKRILESNLRRRRPVGARRTWQTRARSRRRTKPGRASRRIVPDAIEISRRKCSTSARGLLRRREGRVMHLSAGPIARYNTPMSPRKKPLFRLGFVLLALVALSFFAPPVLERSIAAWLRYEARRSGLVLTFSEIHAPLLRPVTITDLKITGAGLDADHLEFDATRIEAGLRLAGIFGRAEKSHLLSSLRIEHAKLFVRGRAPLSAGPIDWIALDRLLPERFEIFADQLRLEQPFSFVAFQDAKISGSKGNSGLLSIGAVEMRAPFLEKRFPHVRGV